ncbi:uncharacterized protein SOCEGT47_015490 [Sorangium cellulosum]|uniref:MalT-like TPR region domain-containing protein n=1 Tax=Sorangium cellulosum TaxID=56 RepID=A0A4P2PWU7_SORCE|nr:hypothetical protein [Sorangium cellulosum]AUX21071.1 uncharacterized protein SOCEGT47_015490 [Sorangium cellulosum]
MTADEAEAWSRIRFHLENQVGFWFALVVGDDPRPRARLREQAEHWCREEGKPFFVHAPWPHELVRLAAKLTGSAEPGIHWIRADGPDGFIEQWDGAASQLFLAMNERREAYRKRLDGGVIVEGRESLKRLLRDLAPDLFSIRAFIAEPGASAETRMPMVPEWRTPERSLVESFALGPDPDRELERAARLEGVTTPDAKRARRRALLAAARGLLAARRTEEAERCVHAFLREQVGDASQDPDEVALNAMHGFIAWVRGDLSLSLRRLDEALRALRVMGDSAPKLILLREVLNVRGEVLVARGDLHSAEASFREQLDALHALAKVDRADQEALLRMSVVRRRIAAIVVTRGDHTAAEQMLHESLGIVEQRASENPTEARWRVELMECHRELSRVLMARGDLARAREACGAALEIAQQFAEEDEGERWAVVLCKLLTALSAIAIAEGDFAAALEWARRNTASALHLLTEHAEDASLGWKIAFGYGEQALALFGQGNLHAAAAALLSAWSHARGLPFSLSETAAPRLLIDLHLEVGLQWLTPGSDAQVAGETRDAPRSEATRRARQAAGFLKRAIWLGDRCIAVAPHDLDIRTLVDKAYKFLAMALTLQGKRRRARQVRRRRRKLRRHRRRSPLSTSI